MSKTSHLLIIDHNPQPWITNLSPHTASIFKGFFSFEIYPGSSYGEMSGNDNSWLVGTIEDATGESIGKQTVAVIGKLQISQVTVIIEQEPFLLTMNTSRSAS